MLMASPMLHAEDIMSMEVGAWTAQVHANMHVLTLRLRYPI